MLFPLHLGCGHCQNAKPKFLKASEAFTAEPSKAFTAVDCTQDTGKYVIKFKCKIIQHFLLISTPSNLHVRPPLVTDSLPQETTYPKD